MLDHILYGRTGFASNPVHSTVNGVVAEITTMEYLEREVQAVVIESDGTSDWKALESQAVDWTELSGEAIEEIPD